VRHELLPEQFYDLPVDDFRLYVAPEPGILDDIAWHIAYQYGIYGITVLILDQPRE